MLNLGLGFPSTSQIAAQFISIANQDTKATPQFTLKYEYAINDKISIGAYSGYYFGETDEIQFDLGSGIDIVCCLLNPGAECCEDNSQSGMEKYQVDVFTLGVLGTYHFYRLPKLDAYSIFRLGYNFINERGDELLNVRLSWF